MFRAIILHTLGVQVPNHLTELFRVQGVTRGVGFRAWLPFRACALGFSGLGCWVEVFSWREERNFKALEPVEAPHRLGFRV